MIRDALQRSVDFVTEHNRITLLVMVLLTGLVVAGIPQINTASQAGGSADQFENVDRIQKAQYIEDAYGNATADHSNRTFRTVHVWDEDGNVLSKESLLTGLQYQEEIRENDSVGTTLHDDGMAGIENLVATRAAGDRNASLDEQIRALENTSAAEVEALVGQTLSEDPRAQRFLPTEHDGSATSTDRRLLVAFDTETDADILSTADSALYESAEDRAEAGFFVLGADAWDGANEQFFQQMIELVLPIALLLILVILAFAYRDLIDVVVGMSGVVLSVLWMFGLLGWLGVEAGTTSIVPVVLVAGLSIDFGFHVFNRYREERGDGDGIRAPMGRGVRLVTTALILVTVTAAIGFLANLANPLPLIRDLGVSITLGVVSALVIFVTVVPALKISIDGLLERVGLDRRKQALGHGTYLRPVLQRSVTLARRAAPVVLILAVLVGAVGGLAWTGLSEESYQQADGEVAEWKQNLPGPLGWEQSEVPEQSNHVEEVYQPANADEAIQSRILLQGDVTSDSTLEDIDAGVREIDSEGLLISQQGTQAEQSPVTAMQRVAQENDTFATVFQQADSDGNGVPDQNLEELYDGFYAADSQTAESVIERTDGEYRSVLVTLSLDAEYAEADSVVPKLDGGAATMEGNADRTATAAGTLALNDAVLDQIIGGIVTTMLIALVAIVLTLTAVFKYIHGSATLGAVVSIPIALVVGLVVGGMYLLEIPLTLLTALLMSLVIGLGIDYNIHIGDRFADELRAGKTSVEALDAAVTGTGGALLGSTLTSAAAFATITLVPHPQLQSFGSIVVIALLTSFLVSVLVLPSILLLWDRYTTNGVRTPDTAENVVAQD
ncbi:efflux RND transporter permease subunit [Salinibaculum salinum]|uniref:efflux RND transporter permease subunit n=1 Tax=Salinibaculum salinum TaxID=3131996 RepID=UPI0030EEB507